MPAAPLGLWEVPEPVGSALRVNTMPHTPAPTFAGRRVQIAGSINPSTTVDVAARGHAIVASLSKSLLDAGAILVLGAGKEPRPENGPFGHPGLVFDWTALEVVGQVSAAIRTCRGEIGRELAVVVVSEKSVQDIPANRKALWDELIAAHAIRVEWIQVGARSGAMIRDRQAEFGDALVILGGGTGVEHLAEIYLDRRRPVVPLDLKLGASRNDGLGGAERLAREARSSPQRFLTLAAAGRRHAGTLLASLTCQDGNGNPTQIAERIFEVLRSVTPPRAFYVRLLDQAHTDYGDVERFFRNVVDHVVAERGFQRMELGTDPSSCGLMNVQLFEDLHDASVAVVDVTGGRPNCFLELGYALGRAVRVIATARVGTSLPWDQHAIPCHFWNPTLSDEDRLTALRKFWNLNVDRPPIVPRR